MYTRQFQFFGTTTLLMHADNIDEADRLDRWRKDPKNRSVTKPGDDRSPAWTWKTYLYHDGKNLAIPTQNFMTCLRQAAAKKIMKRQTTYKEVSQASIFVASEYFDLHVGVEDGKGMKYHQVPVSKINAIDDDAPYDDHLHAVRAMGFDLNAKRARVGQAKHIRVRPAFRRWKVCGSVTVTDEATITPGVLEELLRLAGNVGLGDWRPGCRTPGNYGMFEAQLAGK
jgi:hypothetical protein